MKKVILLFVIFLSISVSAKNYYSVKVTVIHPDKEEKVYRFFPSNVDLNNIPTPGNSGCGIYLNLQENSKEHISGGSISCLDVRAKNKVFMVEVPFNCDSYYDGFTAVKLREGTDLKTKFDKFPLTLISTICE